jgi:hypothetical protein
MEAADVFAPLLATYISLFPVPVELKAESRY